MAEEKDPGYRVLRNALRRLLLQPELVNELKSQDTAKQTMATLHISSENERIAILNILGDISQHTHDQIMQREKTDQDDFTDAKNIEEHLPKSEITDARTFFNTAFSQLQRAYRISMVMSVTMFIIGILFLLLAAWQAISDPDKIATASVVGGIGIIQIVALFYRNPLADIARTVSNAQQAKIAITSYILGITFLNDSIGLGSPTEKHLHTLVDLTDSVIKQLQEYVEDYGEIKLRKMKSIRNQKVVHTDSQTE